MMSVERDSSLVGSSGSDSDDHRLKRQKLEAVTFSEQISASSSKGECKHSYIKNLCYHCGQLVEATGLSVKNTPKGMRIHPDELPGLRDSSMRALHRQRKLCLVLDLDHTLLNTTDLTDLTEEEGYLKGQAESLKDVSGGDLFMLESLGMMTKFRPYVRTFLEEASQMFELYIYTAGDSQYAEQMAELLDPKGKYFDNRIISREYNTVKHQKSLDVVLEHENSVLIIDDSENAWPNYEDHLIVIQRYHYFSSSCRHFGVKSQSLSQLKRDESEPYGSLASILRVLKETHRLFYEVGIKDLSGRDVRRILKQVRREILKGCTLVFSRVFPPHSRPKDHPLWRLAEELGAICAMKIDESVTHVVAVDTGSNSVEWARNENKCIVNTRWIEEAHYHWKKQPEEEFSLE